MATTRDNGYAYLLSLGIMPTVIADAITAAQRADMQPLTEGAAEQLGEIVDSDIERARTNWYFTPRIADKWRRLLDAESRG